MGCNFCKSNTQDRQETYNYEQRVNAQKQQESKNMDQKNNSIQENLNTIRLNRYSMHRESSQSSWDTLQADMDIIPNRTDFKAQDLREDENFSRLFTRQSQNKEALGILVENFRETSRLKVFKISGLMFINQYLIVKYLGKGACGKVFLALNIQDNIMYALKIVQKEIVRQTSSNHPVKIKGIIENMKREIGIMKKMRHRNIVCLKEVVNDPKGFKIILVMEYMPGGCVLARSDLEKGERLPEEIARKSFRDMVKALDYLHCNKIVHGDLKPENVLISVDGQVKLSDFGCSKALMSGNEYLEKCTGTPAFLAPEMMKPGQKYKGRPTDVYALGACLYTFVFGKLPYTAPNLYQLFKIVQSEPLNFPQQPLVSDMLKDLLYKLLTKDPKERIGLEDVMRHPWVNDNGMLPTLCSSQNYKSLLHSKIQAATYNNKENLNSSNNTNSSLINASTSSINFNQQYQQTQYNNIDSQNLALPTYSQLHQQNLKAFNCTIQDGLVNTDEMSGYDILDSDDIQYKNYRDQLLKVLSALSDNVKQYKAGDLLWKQKDIGAFILYIQSGQCEVSVNIRPRIVIQKAVQDEDRLQDDNNQLNTEGSQNQESIRTEILKGEQDVKYFKILADASADAKTRVDKAEQGVCNYHVAMRGEGSFIGEMAFFSNTNLRNASVKARTDLKVNIISKEHFLQFLGKHPQIKYYLKQMIWARQCRMIEIETDCRLAGLSKDLEDKYRQLCIKLHNQ